MNQVKRLMTLAKKSQNPMKLKKKKLTGYQHLKVHSEQRTSLIILQLKEIQKQLD